MVLYVADAIKIRQQKCGQGPCFWSSKTFAAESLCQGNVDGARKCQGKGRLARFNINCNASMCDIFQGCVEGA